MNREKEAALLEFCRRQRVDFDEGAWMSFAEASRLELSAVASYLSGVAWFGHQDALGAVARRLSGSGAGAFPELAKAANFEPSRFAGLLKARMRHASAS